MERFLTAVAEKVTVAWKRLGRELGTPESELEAIDIEEKYTKEKAYRSLLKWYRNLGHSKATKEVLYEALRAIGRTSIAEELENEYGIAAEEKLRPLSEGIFIRCYSSQEPKKIQTSKSDSPIRRKSMRLKFRGRSDAFSRECPQSNKIEITFPSLVIQPKVEEEDKRSECFQSSQNKLQNSAGNCSMAPSTQLNVQEQDINPQVETTPQIVIQLQLTQGEIQSRHPDSAECPQPDQCIVEIPLSIPSLDMVQENTCAECSKTKKNNAKKTYPTIIIQLQFQEQDGNSSNEFPPRCDALYSLKPEDNAEDPFPMLSSRSNTLERDNSPRNSESSQYNVEITHSTNITTQTNMVERDNCPELTESNSNVTILPSKVATKQETREQELCPRCDALMGSTRLRFNQDNVVKEDSFQIHSTRLNVVERDNSPVCSESNHDNVEIPPLSNIATQTKMVGKESSPRAFEEKNDKIRSPQIASQRNVTERDDSSEWSQSNQNNAETSSLTVLTKLQSGKREVGVSEVTAKKPRSRSELIRTCTSS